MLADLYDADFRIDVRVGGLVAIRDKISQNTPIRGA